MMDDENWKTLIPWQEDANDVPQNFRIRSRTGGSSRQRNAATVGASDDLSWKSLAPWQGDGDDAPQNSRIRSRTRGSPQQRNAASVGTSDDEFVDSGGIRNAPQSSKISSHSGDSSQRPRTVTIAATDDESSESRGSENEAPQVSTAPSRTRVRRPRTPSPSGYTSDWERQGPKELAASLAAMTDRARNRMFRLLEHLTNEKGEDLEEKINAMEGIGLDYMPRFPKKVGEPPEEMYFSRRTIGEHIQVMHTALQYLDLLLREVIRDQKAFKSPNSKKWQRVARRHEQLLRGVDKMVSMLELPRRRVPRSAIPDHARGLDTQEARDVRDWLAARDLLNAVEVLWHILTGFATHMDDSPESEVVPPRGRYPIGPRPSSMYPYFQHRDAPYGAYPLYEPYYDHPYYQPYNAFYPPPCPYDYPARYDYLQYHPPAFYPPRHGGPPYLHHVMINDPGALHLNYGVGAPNLLNLNLAYSSPSNQRFF